MSRGLTAATVAALALASLQTASLAQTGGPPPPGQTFQQAPAGPANPPAPPSPPLPTFSFPVQGIPVQVPYHRNYCFLDVRQPIDSQLYSEFAKFSQGGFQLFAISMECNALQRARANSDKGAFEITLYAARDQSAAVPVDKRGFAKETCEAIMGQQTTPLRSTKPREKAWELHGLALAGTDQASAVIEVTNRACYFGSASRAGPDLFVAAIFAITAVQNRFFVISTISFNGSNLWDLDVRAGTLVRNMAQANGEP